MPPVATATESGRAPEARPPFRQTFRAFQTPNFRLFWFCQLFSQMGTWMQRLAQAWLVLKLTDSPLALGTITTVQFFPILVLSLFGGVFADRLPKRKLLAATQLTLFFQALVLGLLTATNRITIPQLYVLAAILGIATAIDTPTTQAFTLELVGREDLPNAVALNATQMNAARITGPAIAGVGIATVGIAGCFLFNAVSYLAVVVCLLLLNAKQLFAAPPVRRGSVFSQLSEGIRFSITTPDVALVLILMAALGTFGYNFATVLPLIDRYVLHAGSVVFGLLNVAIGTGSLVASLLLAYRGRATRRALLLSAAGFSLLLFTLSLSHHVSLALPVLVVLGVFSIAFLTTGQTRLQLVTPPQMQGRVMSLYQVLIGGTTPVGATVVGSVAQRYNVPLAVGLMASLCGSGVAVAVLYSRRMRTRLLPEGEGLLTMQPADEQPAARTPEAAPSSSKPVAP
jgi:MFS family permease